MHCNLKAARRRINRSGLFWPNLYCACALTAIYELLIKILTSTLDSATQISKKESNNCAIRRRFHAVTLTFDPLTLNFVVCGRYTYISFQFVRLTARSVYTRSFILQTCKYHHHDHHHHHWFSHKETCTCIDNAIYMWELDYKVKSEWRR